ncbi:MAG: response regulator [Aquisalimonadaceae bacterium]
MTSSDKIRPGPNLLLVDDEPGILDALTLFLQLEGFRVVQASNGRQALDQLESQRFDLVITDLMMPYMDGAQLIGMMRETPTWANIPIVLSSAALPRDSDLPQRADAFLCRPFGVCRLIEVIKLLMERQQPRRDFFR